MPLSRLKIRWGYLIAFLLLLSSYFLIFYIIGVQINESKEVTHSYTIVNNLESIKAEITDAETGVRGYALTKDERFLEPYFSGSKNVIPLFNELVSITGDHPEYKQKTDSLGSLLNQRLTRLGSVVEKLKTNGVILTDEMT